MRQYELYSSQPYLPPLNNPFLERKRKAAPPPLRREPEPKPETYPEEMPRVPEPPKLPEMPETLETPETPGTPKLLKG